MKKKLSLLLLIIMCSFAAIGCDGCTEKFTVTYKSVEVKEVAAEEEGGSPTFEYTVTDMGTEEVVSGKTITGVAKGTDNVSYYADKYYTVQEIGIVSRPTAEQEAALAEKEYDATKGVTEDLTLYAKNTSYAVFMDLATGQGYTLNYAISEFPSTWNSHQYSTDTDALILDYTSTGFYEFDYNDEKNGYKWIDAMAVGEPKDVTSNYVGDEWGIQEGDTARAWEITIRNDLCWDDGTPITSEDFVQSAIRLLNPLAKNERADDYTYSGDFVVHNARNYVYQGETVDEAYGDYFATAQAAIDAGYTISLDLDLCNTVFRVDWIGADLETLMSNPGYYTTYIEGYFAIYSGEGEERAPLKDSEGNIVTFFSKYDIVNDEDGKIEFTQDMFEDYSNCDGWNPDADTELGMLCSIPYVYPVVEFDDVGIKNPSPTTIVYILDQELSGFYLKYSLSAYLVKTDVYDACDNIGADGKLPEGEQYNNTYCTSSANSPSYGPYKLTNFQLDKYFSFERNTNWWGYNIEANEGLYQTTNVVYTKASSASTRLQMFLSGKFDSYGLSADDMDDYGSSDYTYYTDGDSTWFIALNPDVDKYENAEYNYTTDADGNAVRGTHKDIDKQILAIDEFRMALSFALDRAAYELACDPTGNPAKALFSPLIVSDPENGTAYRTTDAAKNAILKFWALEDQVGVLYDTVDEAIDSITGYNLDMAKVYFDTAYDKAVELGYIDENDVVEILIGTSNATSNYYNKGYDFLVNCYTNAVIGTKLEGKLRFTRDSTLGNGFADALRNGQVDMLFGVGWTGSALNPYGLISAYTTASNRYSSAINFEEVYTTIELPVSAVEGGDSDAVASYTASAAAWTRGLAGNTITVSKGETTEGDGVEKFECSFGTTTDYATRGIVLAGVELAVLEQYTMIPIAYDSSASLKGMKVNFYTEEYVYGVGRGGIKYMTFNYNDAEWAAYVESQNGKLDYKASSGE